MLAKLFDNIGIGNTVKELVGIVSTEDKALREEFVFSSYYTIPYNFQEYYELKEDGIPLIENENDLVVVIYGNQKLQDNSLVGKLKSLANGGSKFISGNKLFEERDEDIEKIEGYCTLYFSKNFNVNIPNQYIAPLGKNEGLWQWKVIRINYWKQLKRQKKV